MSCKGASSREEGRLNRLLFEAEELGADGTVRLQGRRARHLRDVLKVEIGQRLRAGILRGAIGVATVEVEDPESITLRFKAEGGALPVPTIDLVLALPRPKVLSRLLRSIASFGVRHVDIINAWRVERSYFDSPRLRPERLREDLLLGLEQGGHTWLPRVRVWKHFLDWQGSLVEEGREGHRVFADLGARQTLADRASSDAELLIAVGPEGGWIDRERESLRLASFTPVTLGPTTLCSRDAVVAALAQTGVLRGFGSGLSPRAGAMVDVETK